MTLRRLKPTGLQYNIQNAGNLEIDNADAGADLTLTLQTYLNATNV